MITSPLFYLTSSVIPLQITLETLKIVGSHAKNEPNSSGPNAYFPTVILLLKYWTLYGLVFGVVPRSITDGVIWGVPFVSLIFLGISCILTKELVCQFTNFIQSQDSKFMFLFNKLSDVKVSWYQWLWYATDTNENNIASLFVFGEITQLWISLANRFSLVETHYLEKSFDTMMSYVGVPIGILLDQFHSGKQEKKSGADGKTGSRVAGSAYNEDYDLMDDLIDETKKK